MSKQDTKDMMAVIKRDMDNALAAAMADPKYAIEKKRQQKEQAKLRRQAAALKKKEATKLKKTTADSQTPPYQ
jgi:hypothetical protein